ncbi:hypothetical protein MMC13_007230 [Lambiella insularis]|nr:hypothetical protein [Lambiella insularis]
MNVGVLGECGSTGSSKSRNVISSRRNKGRTECSALDTPKTQKGKKEERLSMRREGKHGKKVAALPIYTIPLGTTRLESVQEARTTNEKDGKRFSRPEILATRVTMDDGVKGESEDDSAPSQPEERKQERQ